MGGFSEILLPGSIGIFVMVFGFILFKKFIKIVFIIAAIVAAVVFMTQDSFAFSDGIAGFLTSDKETKKTTKQGRKKTEYFMVQSTDGAILIFERKKFLMMHISPDNEVVLFDKKARQFDFGQIESDETIRNMINKLFGSPVLLNIESEIEDEDEDEDEE